MHLSGFLKNRIPFVVCGFLFDLLNSGKTTLYKDFMEKGATVDILEKRPNLGPEIYADFVDGAGSKTVLLLSAVVARLVQLILGSWQDA